MPLTRSTAVHLGILKESWNFSTWHFDSMQIWLGYVDRHGFSSKSPNSDSCQPTGHTPRITQRQCLCPCTRTMEHEALFGVHIQIQTYQHVGGRLELYPRRSLTALGQRIETRDQGSKPLPTSGQWIGQDHAAGLLGLLVETPGPKKVREGVLITFFSCKYFQDLGSYVKPCPHPLPTRFSR